MINKARKTSVDKWPVTLPNQSPSSWNDQWSPKKRNISYSEKQIELVAANIIASDREYCCIVCDNPQNKAPRTGLHHTLCTCRLWYFSGREMNKDSSGVALICWPVLVLIGSWAAQYLLSPHLVFQSNWGWGNLGFFQLLQSNSSPEGVWNLSGYIELHMKMTESNFWVLLDPGGGKIVLWYTWGYIVQIEFHPGTSWHLDGSGVERHLVGKSFLPHTAFGWQVKLMSEVYRDTVHR